MNFARRTPVPGTGKRRYHSRENRAGRPNGVISSSRALPHRCADEGDSGPAFRRKLRRVENRMWRAEAATDVTL